MFCSNCGAEITGNFCSNCGAPARPAVPRPAEKAYPEPPLGRYDTFLNSWAELRADSIYIHKNNRENGNAYESDLTVPYSDIAAVSIDIRGKKSKTFVICLRTKDNIRIPFAQNAQFLSDPLCIVIEKEEDAAYSVYNFLSKVAEINAYPVPENLKLPKGFKFESLASPAGAANPLSAEDRIHENRKNGIACCPKCGSTSISAGRRGFSVGRALLGGMITPGVGVVAGAAGSNKVTVTCLSCGYKWKM